MLDFCIKDIGETLFLPDAGQYKEKPPLILAMLL